MAAATARHISIGQLARQSGCQVQTIRYYETIGLMPKPVRTAGNQRAYDHTHADRLAFIRHARELGFPLESIRELLKLSDDPDQPCTVADRIATAQLREVESRVERLLNLKAELQRMIHQCRHGKVADCRIIAVLADHSHDKCLSTGHEHLSASL